MTYGPLHVLTPGPIDQWTGGFVYDGRVVAGLRTLGWTVEVHALEGQFPGPHDEARTSLRDTLARLPDDALVVIDGLAMGGMPEPVEEHCDRLRIVGLVHHPLADETAVGDEAAARLAATETRALSSCVGVVATSAFTARRVHDYGVPPDAVRAVPPGIEHVRRARGPGPGQDPVLLCVATVTPRKGHDVLVSALERIRDHSWSCVCVGSLTRDPDHAQRVLDQVRATGLSDRVRFTGECDEASLDAHYDASSVFVLASHYEGYGMVLTEALARGLPVVSTTGGAIPDTVPANAGVLVPAGDPDAFADALSPLVDGAPAAGRRAAMSDRALAYAASLPDWAETARSFRDAIVRLAGSVDAPVEDG